MKRILLICVLLIFLVINPAPADDTRPTNPQATPDALLRLHFPSLGTELSEAEMEKLDELFRSVAELRNGNIIITGYSDNQKISRRSRKKYKSNRALSLARAKSVGLYLKENFDIPPEQLFLYGNSAANPLASNRTKAGRALNRRADLSTTLLSVNSAQALPWEGGVTTAPTPTDNLLLQIDTLLQAVLLANGQPISQRPVFTNALAALENLKEVRRKHSSVAILPLAAPASSTAPPFTTAPSALPLAKPIYNTGAYTLMVNGEPRGEHFVLLKDDDVLIEKAVLEAAGFASGGTSVVVEGIPYTSLASRAPGITYRSDDNSFQLNVAAAISQFKSQQLNLREEEPKALLKTDNSSAFLNYSFELLHDRKLDRESIIIPHEMGIRFRDYLLFSSYSYNKPMQESVKDRYVRLYTNMVKDDQTQMVRYTLGDINAYSGALGGGVAMGGVSVTRNFGMNPFYIRTSGFSISGSVETSSEVEIYRNGALLTKRFLAPGFFDLQNMPLMDGSGDVTLVIKDAFGREKRIDMPYTASQELLRKGLHDFGYSVGFERQELGVSSNSYANVVGVMRHRIGLTDNLTLGVTGELAKEVRNMGVSATTAIPLLGTVGASAATSWGKMNDIDATEHGYAYRVSLTNGFPLAGLFYNAMYSRLTPGYAALSLKPFSNRSLQDVSTSIGIGGNHLGSVSLYGSMRESSIDNARMTTVGTRYSVPLYKWANLAANISKTFSHGQNEWASSLTLTSYLGKLGTASVAASRTGNTDSLYGSLQKSAENDQGLAYRISGQAMEKQISSSDSELSWHGNHGIYSASYQSLQGTEIYGVKSAGSIATLFDDIHFSRPIYDSFAVIKVDHLKDVPVYQGGRMVGATNKYGVAFAPSVSSYGINPFNVKQHDLPFNYSAPELNKTLFPPWRSGSQVVFDVDRVQAIRGYIAVVEAGERKPADFWVLIVTVNGKDEVTPLVREGEFYLENIPSGSHKATIAKGKKRCDFVMDIPKNDEVMIELGQIVCGETKPPVAAPAPLKSAFFW